MFYTNFQENSHQLLLLLDPHRSLIVTDSNCLRTKLVCNTGRIAGICERFALRTHDHVK